MSGALTGITRATTTFAKGAKKSGQPRILTTSFARPGVTQNTMIDWAGIEAVINRGMTARGIAKVKGTNTPRVYRGSKNYEGLIAKRRAAARAKLKHGAKGSYHMPGAAGGEWSRGFRADRPEDLNPLNKTGYYH